MKTSPYSTSCSEDIVLHVGSGIPYLKIFTESFSCKEILLHSQRKTQQQQQQPTINLTLVQYKSVAYLFVVVCGVSRSHNVPALGCQLAVLTDVTDRASCKDNKK